MAPKKTKATAFKAIQTIEELLGEGYTGPMRTAFPDVEIPYAAPFGYLVLVQLRQPLKVSKGGILIPEGEQDNERYRTLASAPKSVENKEPKSENNPVDLSKDLHKGDTMEKTDRMIEEAM